MNLTEQEKEKIKAMIDRGEPLPPKYKLLLFADAPEVELIWEGKTNEVTNVVLPFQSIEQIDEPRMETKENLGLFTVNSQGRQSGGWTNKLIWGDNKLVLSSLKNGPLRREIEAAGGLKLIYIDPPFDVGADFSVDIEVGEDDTLTKEPSVLEELAYRDTWGKGTDSYLSMMYERLKIMRDLLAEDGSIWVHCDWRVTAHIRLALNEVFGAERLVNEIIWKRQSAHSDTKQGAAHLGRIHDTIYYYRKTQRYTLNMQYDPYSQDQIDNSYKYIEEGTGRRYSLGDITAPGGAKEGKGNPQYEFLGVTRYWRFSKVKMQQLYEQGRIIQTQAGRVPLQKRYLDEMPGVALQDLWTSVSPVSPQSSQRTGYATQKPEALLERITKASSNEGDLVADFFCGSGTTLAVAEKLGRKWIGSDIGRFAIHTTRKRIIDVQRQLKKEAKLYRSFEILNLGKYERQYFMGINPNLPEAERREQSIRKEEHYLGLILSAYKAERVFQSPPFHGRKGSTWVFVGPIDAPVTEAQINEIVASCKKKQISKVDILGFEFEMGVVNFMQDEAKQKGVSLALKYIPKDVFDKRAVERGQVKFYDVAYVEVLPKVKGLSVTVELKDFGVFYRQDDVDVLGGKLKAGASKVTVENGQVVKVSKDKKGVVSREVLTKKWTDWIDYWAVDFEFENKKEIIRVVEGEEEKELWTGNYIFENEWQSFRTRKDRSLLLVSAPHEYPKKGRYKIAVKVIDIFGNDTTKVVEVTV